MSKSQTILGESMENTKLLVIFAILAVVNLIGFSIKDFNFKICYWLSIALIIVAIINLNMSIGFYIRLRNDKGISGKRGERGDKGAECAESVLKMISASQQVQNQKGKIGF